MKECVLVLLLFFMFCFLKCSDFKDMDIHVNETEYCKDYRLYGLEKGWGAIENMDMSDSTVIYFTNKLYFQGSVECMEFLVRKAYFLSESGKSMHTYDEIDTLSLAQVSIIDSTIYFNDSLMLRTLFYQIDYSIQAYTKRNKYSNLARLVDTIRYDD